MARFDAKNCFSHLDESLFAFYRFKPKSRRKLHLFYLVGDAEDADLVAAPVELLHGGVVGVLVRHEEGSLRLAPVRVKPVLLSQKENN